MNTLSIVLLGVAIIIAGLENVKQDEKISELSKRIEVLEERDVAR